MWLLQYSLRPPTDDLIAWHIMIWTCNPNTLRPQRLGALLPSNLSFPSSVS